jgi:hypothetical protein
MSPWHRPLGAFLIDACLAAAACEQGGSTKNLTGEVKVEVDHHMAGLGGQVQFEPFPIKESTGYADAAMLHFGGDSRYTLTRPGQETSAPENYYLAKSGGLTITVAQRSRPALRWPGFYDLQGDAYFFVSREPTFPRLFLGVRQIETAPAIADAWHVFGDTIVFAATTDTASPDRVARSHAGTLTFDAAGKITDGSWKDSTGSTVLVTGTAKTASRGSVDLTAALAGGPATGTQSWSGGIAKNVGVLADRVATDKHVGVLVLVRQQSTGLDAKRIVGTWRVGLHAVFVNPARPGVDVATGLLTMNADLSWKLKLDVGTTEWAGTYRQESLGALTLTEKSQNQDWPAAIDGDYRTIAFTDRTVERTANPFIGVFIGVRE